MPRTLAFATWREILKSDCVEQSKMLEFNCLGEAVLRILYDNGLDPTVKAIIKNGLNGQQKKSATQS